MLVRKDLKGQSVRIAKIDQKFQSSRTWFMDGLLVGADEERQDGACQAGGEARGGRVEDKLEHARLTYFQSIPNVH